MPSLGIRTNLVHNGSRLNLSPEVKQYISGLTTPLSSEQVTKLDTFVRTVKTGLGITALSEAFDVMYILGGETAESSLKNIVKDAHHATAVNSPAFTELEGFQGNGTSSYINSNYAPISEGQKFTLNDAGFGIYSRTDRAYNNGAVNGIYSYPYLGIMPKRIGNLLVTWANSITQATDRISDSLGLLSVFRNSATNSYVSKNKTLGLDIASNSTAIPTGNVFLLCSNNGLGTAQQFDSVQLSFAFLGKSLNQSEVNVLVDAFEAYMDSNGKGVIA